MVILRGSNEIAQVKNVGAFVSGNYYVSSTSSYIGTSNSKCGARYQAILLPV